MILRLHSKGKGYESTYPIAESGRTKRKEARIVKSLEVSKPQDNQIRLQYEPLDLLPASLLPFFPSFSDISSLKMMSTASSSLTSTGATHSRRRTSIADYDMEDYTKEKKKAKREREKKEKKKYEAYLQAAILRNEDVFGTVPCDVKISESQRTQSAHSVRSSPVLVLNPLSESTEPFDSTMISSLTNTSAVHRSNIATQTPLLEMSKQISRTYFPARQEEKGGEDPMETEEKDDSKSEGSSMTLPNSSTALSSIASDASAHEHDIEPLQVDALLRNHDLPRGGESHDDSMENAMADPEKGEVHDSRDSSASLPHAMTDSIDLVRKISESARDHQLSPPTSSESTVSSLSISSNFIPDFLDVNENYVTTTSYMKSILHQRPSKRPRRVLADSTRMNAALETVENESDEGTSALRGNHKRRRSSGEEDGIEDSSEEQKDSIRAENAPSKSLREENEDDEINNRGVMDQIYYGHEENEEERDEVMGVEAREAEEERVPDENDENSHPAAVSSNIGTTEGEFLPKSRSGRALKAVHKMGAAEKKEIDEIEEADKLSAIWSMLIDNLKKRPQKKRCCALKSIARRNRKLFDVLPSSIGGKGLFLKKNIRIGTVITYYDGFFGTLSELRRTNRNQSHYMMVGKVGYDGHPEVFAEKGGRKLVGQASMTNHSRTAYNCVMKNVRGCGGECNSLVLLLVANKEMEEGTELLWDYGRHYRDIECVPCKRRSARAEEKNLSFQPCDYCSQFLFLDD
ncbi:hypothetical protein PRIPAC_95676 [Pristionchus pacificus]|uniref:SET domain-containing protein n=1 Tax=Pristionchus pacificus TaxID=54126 RepID=A0A2A6CU46_PRIPA|nr:hypothetical protein PRIPAC_95676 [Pristionchus pacificus]|eukprot:PDM81563.1 hypothetical protein PRIPAC_30544 [Pristionchus pacificus]